MLPTRTKTVLAITAVAVLTLAGCGAANNTSTGAAPTGSTTQVTPTETTDTAVPGIAPAGSELQGKRFTATDLTGQDVADLGKITIGFTDDAMQASAGCNSFSGPADLSGGSLEVQPSQTEMACEGLMDQEKWFGEFLSSSPTWTYTDGTLTLTQGSVTLTLAEEATTPNAGLEGTRWQLSSIITGDTASSVPAGVDPAITIADGRIAFDAQCNSVGGDVEITDATLDVTNVLGTLMACEDPRGQMESLLTSTIAGTVNYAIEGDKLTIEGAENTTLEFTVDEDGAAYSPVETPAESPGESSVPTEKIDNSIPQIPEDGTQMTSASPPATIDPLLAGLSFTTPIPDALNGEVITLTFNDRILTNAGCNNIGSTGEQSTAGGVLAVGSLLSTKMFCEVTGEAETAWMDFLESQPTWALDGPTLTLTSAGTTYTLTSTT